MRSSGYTSKALASLHTAGKVCCYKTQRSGMKTPHAEMRVAMAQSQTAWDGLAIQPFIRALWQSSDPCHSWHACHSWTPCHFWDPRNSCEPCHSWMPSHSGGAAPFLRTPCGDIRCGEAGEIVTYQITAAAPGETALIICSFVNHTPTIPPCISHMPTKKTKKALK